MEPIKPTPVQEVWAGPQFLPRDFDSREGVAFRRAVWAKFWDNKTVSFQPKKGVSLETATLHLQTLKQYTTIPLGVRFDAMCWLASQWFESFELT